jgi:ABC-type glycerol-3-phosphate transport system substrate-binding protein
MPADSAHLVSVFHRSARGSQRVRRSTARLGACFVGIALVEFACGGRPTARTPEAPLVTPPPSGATPLPGTGTITVWTIPQGDKEVPIKAYEKAFEKQNPGADIRIVVIPEEGYTPKVQTALEAGNPPDVALLEPDLISTVKAGRWVDLVPFFESWGVDPTDFNAGGLSRATIENDQSKGIFAIGDFLGGNVLVYNRSMFAAAGVPTPPTDRSLTYQEYDTICRTLGHPNPDPAKVVYGCSLPDFSYLFAPVFGENGHKAIGYMNAPKVTDAFQIGAGLIRDGFAPGSAVLDTIGESDLFAQAKMGITWTDFTEVEKYKKNGIDFGLAPFYVIVGEPSYVDVFTAAWGTIKGAKNEPGALAFLRFIATDAQRIRPEVTPDPPLSTKVAAAIGYGKDDPIKQQYLHVLALAPPPDFVPPGVDAWDPAEVLRLLTVEKRSDAQAILDKMAAKSQTELDRAWRQWESLGG